MRFSHLGVVATVIAATASLAAAAALAPRAAAPASAPRAAVATLQPGWFAYRPLGDFESDGRTIDAPARAARLDAPLDVMVEPVSQADYARCVAAAACPKLKFVDPAAENLPVVGVSWLEATAYAEYYAAATGEDWRLPTDAEWAYAAAERFRGEPPPAAERRRFRPPLARQVRRRFRARPPAEGAAAVRPFRLQHARRRRSFRQRLGMDEFLLRAARGRRRWRGAPADPQLPRARARRRAPHVHERFHPRRRDRRLLGRPAADQSRLPPGAFGAPAPIARVDQRRRRAVCRAVAPPPPRFARLPSPASQGRMSAPRLHE